ncbi:MAG: transglycosylase domain-containing protein [Rhodoferax sp.]|nr:transglycosylase domain-containing protein [Rhodoferax sp.]
MYQWDYRLNLSWHSESFSQKTAPPADMAIYLRGLLNSAADDTAMHPPSPNTVSIPIQPEQVAAHYLQALLHYEDRWFYWHFGVNPLALLRASWQWLRHGEVISGGSTLSMQVARAIEPMPHTVRGKLQQIWRAWQLEARLSKREILQLYLNHALFWVKRAIQLPSFSRRGAPQGRGGNPETAAWGLTPSPLRGTPPWQD